jgi:glycosyltransferase involved in cell wall biosynthesis
MALRIGFDATAAVHQGAGIGRYTRSLLAALAGRDDPDRFAVYFCGPGSGAGSMPALADRFRVRKIPASDRVMNAVWQRARIPLPVQAFTGHVDVVHSPDFTLPPTGRTPTVLTVHDLAFLRHPDCAVPSLREYLETVVPRSARRATRIIAVSENTRHDVIDLLDVPPERVITVYEAPGPMFTCPGDRNGARGTVAGMGIQGPFVLAVGTLEPRKNYARLFEAYALLRQHGVRHRLIIAGRLGWMYEPALQRVRELGLAPFITVLQPADRQLQALYMSADVVVYPSLYEGFGIPPLEALACGAPVACSEASSLPEVVGEAAVLFDPHEPEEIAGAIRSILESVDLQERLRAAGPERASQFSWEHAAAATMRVYREAAGA